MLEVGRVKSLRKTRNRQRILCELQKLRSHPTAEDLFRVVRQYRPQVSLGTVYRNLTTLAEAGVIQRLDSGSPRARFDGNPRPHCHIRCTRCDRIEDVHVLPSDLFGRELDTLNAYKLLGYHLEFSGLCPECRSKLRNSDDWTFCW